MITVACVGDNVVDVYPSLGMGFPGGNAVNVAVAARRSGAAASYTGVIGAGPDGSVIARALAAEGVQTPRMRVADGPNAYSVIDLDGADRVFGDHDAGVSGFQLDAADLAYLAEVGFVHTGECSMLEDQVAEIAAVARVSYDFSDRPWEYAAPLLRYAWMASFSASHLAPDEAADLAARAVAAGPRVVLVTEGPRGALLRVGGVVVRLPARSGEVVDTLGAGDAVIGGVLTGLLRGEEPAQALGAGLDLAARACTHHGGFGYGEPLDRRWPMALRQRVRSAG